MPAMGGTIPALVHGSVVSVVEVDCFSRGSNVASEDHFMLLDLGLRRLSPTFSVVEIPMVAMTTSVAILRTVIMKRASLQFVVTTPVAMTKVVQRKRRGKTLSIF